MCGDEEGFANGNDGGWSEDALRGLFAAEIAAKDESTHAVPDDIHSGDWLAIIEGEGGEIRGEGVAEGFDGRAVGHGAVVEVKAGAGVGLKDLVGDAEILLERSRAAIQLEAVEEDDGRIAGVGDRLWIRNELGAERSGQQKSRERANVRGPGLHQTDIAPEGPKQHKRRSSSGFMRVFCEIITG